MTHFREILSGLDKTISLSIKDKGYLLVLGSILVLFIIKLPHLSLPYFWDEAWSYMHSIYQLADNWTYLFPGNGPSGLTKGHPILFFLFNTLWINIFGETILIVHLLQLIVSGVTIWAVYKTAGNIFNQQTGVFAAVLTTFQTVFLAQATMVLPEILLALFTLLTIKSYIKKEKARTVFWAFCSVMTKEAGLVIALFIVAAYFFENIKNIRNPKTILNVAIYSIPVLAYLLHILAHRIFEGWFLYPDHTSHVNFSLTNIWKTISTYITFVFSKQGRIVLTILAIVALIYNLIKKKFTKLEKQKIILIFLFITVYFLFLSLNFNTLRYTMTALLPVIIVFSFLLNSIIKKDLLRYIILSFLVTVFIAQSVSNKNVSDVTLGYTGITEVNRSAVRYCQKTYSADTKIMTTFLMSYYLSNIRLGYLENTYSSSDKFNRFVSSPEEQPDVVVISSSEPDEKFNTIKESPDYILVKKFENNMVQAEIYERKK